MSILDRLGEVKDRALQGIKTTHDRVRPRVDSATRQLGQHARRHTIRFSGFAANGIWQMLTTPVSDEIQRLQGQIKKPATTKSTQELERLMQELPKRE